MDSTAILLLCAILSDTVLLNSPTTTDRDRAAIDYLEDLIDVNAMQLGREMFDSTSDVSEVPAHEIVTRDAKEYQLPSGETDLDRSDRDGRQRGSSNAAASSSTRSTRSASATATRSPR